MATMNRRPMRGGRPNPAQRPAPPPMVNRSPGGPSGGMSGVGRDINMPDPAQMQRPAPAQPQPMQTMRPPPAPMQAPPPMPANGGFIPGAMGGPSKLNSSPGGPSGGMSAMGGPDGGGAMLNRSPSAIPYAKGGKVSAKTPVKAKAKSTCMKTGGMVKSSASSRGDGIAQRGKTRGKYC